MTKKCLFIEVVLFALTACDQENIAKQEQTIFFDNVPAQISVAEGSLRLTATASSGLFVLLASNDENIAVIDRDQAVFRQPGIASITASQPGDERFYEATNVVRTFEILSVDPSKKEQIIRFELESSWRSSKGVLALKATASSGLPVTYTSSNEAVGIISGNYLLLDHYYESKGETVYKKQIAITASQAGNSEYNPATNVTKWVDATIDVAH
jgi:hypothetical protein